MVACVHARSAKLSLHRRDRYLSHRFAQKIPTFLESNYARISNAGSSRGVNERGGQEEEEDIRFFFPPSFLFLYDN